MPRTRRRRTRTASTRTLPYKYTRHREGSKRRHKTIINTAKRQAILRKTNKHNKDC